MILKHFQKKLINNFEECVTVFIILAESYPPGLLTKRIKRLSTPPHSMFEFEWYVRKHCPKLKCNAYYWICLWRKGSVRTDGCQIYLTVNSFPTSILKQPTVQSNRNPLSTLFKPSYYSNSSVGWSCNVVFAFWMGYWWL